MNSYAKQTFYKNLLLNRTSRSVLSKVTLLPFLLLMTSCGLLFESTPKGWGMSPHPLTGVKNFPSTDSEYGKGFKDGCHSGWNVIAKGFVTDVSKSKFDYKRMQKGADYGVGWWDGYEQCTYILDHDVV